MALTPEEEAAVRRLIAPEIARMAHEEWRLRCVAERGRLRAGAITLRQYEIWQAANPEPALPARRSG